MKRLLLNEKFTLAIVILNVVVIFIQECGLENSILSFIDILCSLLFLIEMIVKNRVKGLRKYWTDGWDILDGTITLLSLPSILVYFVPQMATVKILIALRALRVFKMLRTARHFPNINQIWQGFKLALRQSAAFLLAYFVIIVVLAMFNSALFSSAAPDYFATPLDGIYSIFQMFTIEGWYEIPNAVVGGMHPFWIHIVRTYFCILLIGGGIIGMSLINSIFVDAMAADNNDDVKASLEKIEEQLAQTNQQIDTLSKELHTLLHDSESHCR